ncbi:hypothetical protein [Streptomyces atriruber]|uniref:hypothetical protein n=1 Tax=Streptomyces atriruber TaxID=545121 RepID=UPI000B189FB8|nr:hypothetical protein [Streptomyces atriruber]
MTAARPLRTEDLSPECQLGMCSLCPGDDIPVYAPGKRPDFEPPLFIRRCAHGCKHGGRPKVPRSPDVPLKKGKEA